MAVAVLYQSFAEISVGCCVTTVALDLQMDLEETCCCLSRRALETGLSKVAYPSARYSRDFFFFFAKGINHSHRKKSELIIEIDKAVVKNNQPWI
jgi:hypothetical protein